MPSTKNAGWTRLGLLALPLAGLLTFASTLTHQPDPTTDFPGYAEYVSTTEFLVGHLVGSIGGAVLAIGGAVALFAALADGRTAGRALAGLLFSIAGDGLMLPIFGVAAFAASAVGEAHLAGEPGMAELNDAIYGTPLGVTALLAVACYAAGAILFGLAVWRSGAMPRWAGASYALAGPLISIVGLVVGEAQTPGAILWTIGSGWIAWSVWRRPATGAPAAERSPTRRIARPSTSH